MAGLNESRRGLVLAGLAVLFFATSPVLVRWAAPASPYGIALGRLAVAAALVFTLARLKGTPVRIVRADRWLFVGFGLITALHFVFYIASLSFTSIAHSLAIVYTAPIFVTLFSGWFLHEPIAPRKWLGVAIAVAGIVILVRFEPQWDSRMAFGDLLALGSAITFGLYSVAGRSQRTRYPLFTYATVVYGAAALCVLPMAVLNQNWTELGWSQLLAIVALGLLPLGIGHTLYNAALRHTHATNVNLVATQEVTLGILLGVIFLGEIPDVSSIIGALVTLLGVVFVIL
ncbi:MAG: DMT family transporter [Anaerolineae bacterium]|nr:MAG: DMT family transporter [Anaerolineae bacterium]